MKTVLLVEDDELNAKLIAKLIEREHYAAVAVASAEEALERIAEIRPDLVLMDIMLPGMNGLAATEKLKMNPAFKDLPVVGLSALAMPEDRQRALESGCADYIVKPIDFARFRSVLKRYLG